MSKSETPLGPGEGGKAGRGATSRSWGKGGERRSPSATGSSTVSSSGKRTGRGERPPGTRLADLASPWLVACAAVRLTRSHDAAEPLRARAQDMRANFERRASDAGHNELDIKDALFALAALAWIATAYMGYWAHLGM